MSGRGVFFFVFLGLVCFFVLVGLVPFVSEYSKDFREWREERRRIRKPGSSNRPTTQRWPRTDAQTIRLPRASMPPTTCNLPERPDVISR